MSGEKKTSYVLMPRFDEKDFDCWGISVEDAKDLSKIRYKFSIKGGPIRMRDVSVKFQDCISHLDENLLKDLLSISTITQVLSIFRKDGKTAVEEYLKTKKEV